MSTSTTTITTLAPRGHEITVKCHPSPTVQSSSTIFDDSFNSVITVDSVSAAEHHLRSYLALANPIYDLRLRIREAVLFDKPVKNLLRAAFRQKRRYSYDRESLILRVYARSRPIHDAVLRLVSEFVARAGEASFFAPDEKECIGVGNTGVMLTRSHFSSKSGKKKPQAWTKYPDAVILFDDPNSKKDLPSVVFEVGFSESYPDLLSDAQQWLHKSSGKIRVVVLVDIVEDTKTLQTLQMSKRAQSRIRRLLTQFGTASAKAREGVDHEGPDPESDQEQYDNIEAQIVVEDWVGPISASLEVWHTVDNKPKMRGERIVSSS